MSKIMVKKFLINSLQSMYNNRDNLMWNAVFDNNSYSAYFYKDNSKTGFYQYMDAMMNTRINGVNSGSNDTNFLVPASGSYLYYIATGDYTLIGSNPNKMLAGCVKAKKVSDESETWIWFFEKSNKLYFYADDSIQTTILNYAGLNSMNAISLAPIVVETNDDVVVSDFLFFMPIGKKAIINQAFLLDSHEYMILGTAEADTRAVIRLN